ncbi:helix-turn-helix transcriptional regulator [Flavobacterium artemisiae]|uniref:Helix-turn-helix transcriptional regulator n=1 Tax=Flavobacterium artemisiae TaxID=2126556 RepID=A0ABW4HD61_9FLAO
MITHSVKKNIRSIRELKNYTQEYMADELGISQAGYSKIEKGKTDLSFKKLTQIASIFEISPEVLFHFDTQNYLDNLGHHEPELIKTADEPLITVQKLYEDKIRLLELLLSKTDLELKRYTEKYGRI